MIRFLTDRSVRLRDEQCGGVGFDAYLERCVTDQLSIRLRGCVRHRFHHEMLSLPEEHARVVTEVLPGQPPQDSEGVPHPLWTKDAQVQLSVILTDFRAQSQPFVQNRTETGHH